MYYLVVLLVVDSTKAIDCLERLVSEMLYVLSEMVVKLLSPVSTGRVDGPS